MSKRGPTSELNHDNWDDKYEPEEPGTFTRAAGDTLQKRVIRTAKRRSASDQNKNPFANFGGFKTGGGTTATKPDSKATFSFVSNTTPKTNGISDKPKTLFGIPSESKEDNKLTEKSSSNESDEYIANLKKLNKSVSDWIKMYVDKDEACILTPIFKDYEMYLEKIKNEKPSDSTAIGTAAVSDVTKSENSGRSPLLLASNDIKDSNPQTDSKDTNPQTSGENNAKPQTAGENNVKTQTTEESSIKSQTAGESNQTPKPSIFSSFTSDKPVQSFFTSKPDPSKLMTNPFLNKLDKNGDKSTNKPEGGFKFESPHATGFSFGSSSSSSSSKPFTFGNVASTEKEKQEQTDDQSDEPPPKTEFKPIEEEGSVYSVRCKVFVKKESEYTDLGVGTLFIKKVNGEKHQLLVRAETVTGNILINVLLSKSLPTQRMGKNNVMLVCMPTPQASVTTSCLLRVKTAELADELLETMNKFKN